MIDETRLLRILDKMEKVAVEYPSRIQNPSVFIIRLFRVAIEAEIATQEQESNEEE